MDDMWVVTTTDGREYSYDTFEAAWNAARTLFQLNWVKIYNEEEGFFVRSKNRRMGS